MGELGTLCIGCRFECVAECAGSCKVIYSIWLQRWFCPVYQKEMTDLTPKLLVASMGGVTDPGEIGRAHV